ncbi:MAG: hypothetical protein IIB35_12450 [Gemmatimonadetes bacterium]|nr:hypothetical protein [Gemmatimonadota bacterium]MCH8934654.1 hypothetical protein [Gemmatimonadota bacterium]
MNRVSESYVKLVLAVGQYDPDYVDAYYGPVEWQEELEVAPMSLITVRGVALQRIDELDRDGRPVGNELLKLRFQYLTKQLESLVARTRMLEGDRMSFDEESKALYDAVAPTNSDADFRSVLDEIAAALPGEESLHDRYVAFRDRFVIPPDRVDEVFRAAIQECRARTVEHVDLPAPESFVVEYVNDKPWSAYNWYQGRYQSLIQVNTDFPIYIDRALDLACHEGYPGHHVYNVLLERHLTREKRWVEYSVYPLFSPQSLIAEGSANYGVEVAFPGEERLAFERDTLFPLAGLDPSRAAEYSRVMQLVARLSYAGNEAARRYLNGEVDRKGTAAWLTQFTLMSLPRAQQRVDFFDRYRSYVINYNLGRDLVRDYVESGSGDRMSAAERWRKFASLLTSPRLPSGLR